MSHEDADAEQDTRCRDELGHSSPPSQAANRAVVCFRMTSSNQGNGFVDQAAALWEPGLKARNRTPPAGCLECRATFCLRRAGGNRFAHTVPTRGFLAICGFGVKCLISLAPRAGFEPATIRLTVECSTAELPRNRRKAFASRAYNKASEACKGRNRQLRHGIKNGLKRPAGQ